MKEDPHSESLGQPRSRRKLWTALLILAVLLALLVVPPYIGISRYKRRITELISTALQRPVRLSGVELRILPWPGFVISDLTVQEDPAFGAQPVLHANSVVAGIRLWSLWRGQLQISRISVDEASLNLVHTPDGRWNLEDLFHTAADRQRRSGGPAVPFPYMEATNSRINVNNGAEKLPFSLMNADASLWQESGGAWRVRLRGQPARTDVSLDMADTGIVRLEATLHATPRLEQMPIQIDLDWREAQLGQLSRLLLGSDEGWRGDLTGELHLDGTIESAKVRARLRASGVHRIEFAPAAPLDFDATCNFVFHSAPRTLQNLACDSPIGDGHVHLGGDLALSGATPDLTIAVDHIPAQAGLDLLRTLRSDLDPGLQASGLVNGTVTYQPQQSATPQRPHGRKPKHAMPLPSPLTGSLAVEKLNISGGPLNQPVNIDKLVLEPTASEPPALASTVPISAGAPSPLILDLRFAPHGFQVALHGPASLSRLREFAQAAGFSRADALAQISAEPAEVNLTAEGPWLPSILPPGNGNGSMRGTLTLKQATWRTDFLAGPVLLPSATVHLDNGALNWDPADFSFGPVKGTASLALPAACAPGAVCVPQFTVHFATLDAAALQAALLGARQRGTLLSSLLSHFSSAKTWPSLDGSVDADELQLGPFALHNLAADLRIRPTGAEITSLDADVLGGKLAATGDLKMDDRPSYKVDGTFTHLNPNQVGELLGMKWSGGAIDGAGHLEMAGYSTATLASKAVGTLHFTWAHGSVSSIKKSPVPAALSKFDEWTADAEIAHNQITLGKNRIVKGKREASADGSAAFGTPAAVTFAAPAPAKRTAR